MFNDPLFLILGVACLVVVFILALGIGGFAKGGDFNRKNANRLMRYRIYAQAIAVALLMLFLYFRGTGG
jgi:uncharacterized membrane protein affecting hemolysin expression